MSTYDKKAVWGWSFYDWANSAFQTSILSVIFGVYFSKVIVPASGVQFLGHTMNGTSLWSFLNSAVMFGVIVLSPMMGALADHRHCKRLFLIIWAVIGAFATMALVISGEDTLVLSTVLAFIAIFGYEMSLVFYNAFLNDISDETNAGFVSGFGFALGYIGGGLCLGLNMAMIAKPALFGIPADHHWPLRLSFLVVGVWWLIFSFPTFAWVRDRVAPRAREFSLGTVMAGSFGQLKETLSELKFRRDLAIFLLSYVLFNDGIQTILLMASIFGAEALGMTTAQLGLCYLLIQFVAFAGSYACGKLADAWNHKSVILGTIIIYTGIVGWAVVMKSSREFWILGVIVGLILGGSQAASRSLFSLMIPDEKSGEYFALFSVVGKASALLGPFVFGIVNQLAGLRAAVGSLAVFFVVGGALLLLVDEQRGRALVRQNTSKPSPTN